MLPDPRPTNLVGIASTEEPSVLRVSAGDPSHSYLYWKITGDPRIKGERMPKGLLTLGRTLGVRARGLD